MTKNQDSGRSSESDVIRKIKCPHCGRKLITLPPGYAIYDIQCSGCVFRAQLRSASRKPGKSLPGSGWNIQKQVLRSGFTIPPVIANYRWKDKTGKNQKIVFYPFIPRNHLKVTWRHFKSGRKPYKMYGYIKLDELPQMILYP